MFVSILTGKCKGKFTDLPKYVSEDLLLDQWKRDSLQSLKMPMPQFRIYSIRSKNYISDLTIHLNRKTQIHTVEYAEDRYKPRIMPFDREILVQFIKIHRDLPKGDTDVYFNVLLLPKKGSSFLYDPTGLSRNIKKLYDLLDLNKEKFEYFSGHRAFSTESLIFCMLFVHYFFEKEYALNKKNIKATIRRIKKSTRKERINYLNWI